MADTLTAAERQDVIEVGRTVRRLEIKARWHRAVARRAYADGEYAFADTMQRIGDDLTDVAAHLKSLWSRADGFAAGYCS